MESSYGAHECEACVTFAECLAQSVCPMDNEDAVRRVGTGLSHLQWLQAVTRQAERAERVLEVD